MIGAGVIGLACAWRLAEAGLETLVLDREAPGAGASGVAAGMLAPVSETSFGEQRLLRLNLESARRWPRFDAELRERTGRATGYEPRGALMVAVDRDDAEELGRIHELQRSLELGVEWLTRSECRALEPGLAPGIAGGIRAPQDHQADPRALVEALRRAVTAAGGEVARDAEVRRVEPGENVLELASKLVTAEHLVVAAGAHSASIEGLKDVAPPVRPVKGQILRLRGRETPLASHAVHTPRCYVVPRASGEVVVGATVEERGFDESVTAGGVHRLLEAAWEVLPDVGELELLEVSARLRPGTPDNVPVVGRRGGVVWATGHYRNGILLAPLTADAVLEAVAGGESAPLGDDVGPARFAGAPLAGAPS